MHLLIDSSAQSQPQTRTETPAAAAAPRPSGRGSPFNFSRTQQDSLAAEAAMPAPPTGKPAGSFPAYGTPGWSSAAPTAGAAASSEGTNTAPTPKEAFKWSGAFASGTSATTPVSSQPQKQAPVAPQPGAFAAPMPSSGGPADAAAGIPPSAPKAAAADTRSSSLRFPSVADWSPSPPPDTGKAPAFGTPGWSPASAVAGGAAKVPAFGTRGARWGLQSHKATHTAAQSGVPFTEASTADGTTAAAAHPSHGPATPLGAASGPAAPRLPKFCWPEQTSGSNGGLASGSFNLGAFRPGDNANAGGAAASGAFKFSSGQPLS
ncbi:hypothetical protein WJX77_003209 [Trebouxia sp. C0004]